MFWVISVYFNVRNILPKSGTFPPGHSVYVPRVSNYNNFQPLTGCSKILPNLRNFSVRSTITNSIINCIQKMPQMRNISYKTKIYSTVLPTFSPLHDIQSGRDKRFANCYVSHTATAATRLTFCCLHCRMQSNQWINNTSPQFSG